MTTVWNLSGAYGLGVEVVLRDIPLRQETIEICQRLELNPYRLYGAGSWLLASPNGGRLVKNLEKLGIPAAVMGRVTGGNARAVIHGETVAYLERPRRDELKNLEDYKEAIGHERENSGSY
jgi:hydrogenase maturation factor